MGLLKWLTKRDSLENPRLSLNDPGMWVKLFGTEADSGVKITPDSALTIATYWQCCHLLCDDFSKLPTVVFKNKKDESHEKDREHQAYYILRRKTNQFMTAGIFKKTLLGHALTYGNGYGWIIRDGSYAPTEILLLRPDKTTPFLNNGRLWYETWVGDKKYVLTSDEVFHLRGLGFDGLKGYGVAHYAMNSLGLTLAAEKFGNKHFSNGSKASGVLTYPGHLKPEARKNLASSFEEAHQGLTNAHKTIVLEEGAKFTPLSITPNEAQYIELREFQRKEVGSWFKIPPSKLGDPDSVSYNSLEQWNQAYLESALDPWLCAFEEEAFDKLLTEVQKTRESHFVEFNRAALLRTALADRYQAYSTAIQWGWYSVNDVRRKENEPLIGPEGDVYLVPANMNNRKAIVNQTELPSAGKQGDKPNAPGDKTPSPGKEPKRALLEDTFGRALRRLTGVVVKAAKRDDFDSSIESLLGDYHQDFLRIARPVLDVIAITDPASGVSSTRIAARHLQHVRSSLEALDGNPERAAAAASWASTIERDALSKLLAEALPEQNIEGEHNAHDECGTSTGSAA